MQYEELHIGLHRADEWYGVVWENRVDGLVFLIRMGGDIFGISAEVGYIASLGIESFGNVAAHINVVGCLVSGLGGLRSE